MRQMSDEKQRFQRIGADIHQTFDRPPSGDQLHGAIILSSERVARAGDRVVQGRTTRGLCW